MTKRKAPTSASIPETPPIGGAFVRLEALGSEKLGIVDAQLLQGKTAGDVARMLQDEWKVMTDLNFETLKKQLIRYKNARIVPRTVQFQQKVLTDTMEGRLALEAKRGIGVMVEKLNVMEYAEELVELQRKRIMKLKAKEEKLPEGLVLDALSKLLPDYGRSLSMLANLQMETGLIKRAPKIITGQIDLRDPAKDRPSLEIEFSARESRLDAGAELVQLMGEVIEGEYERIESGDRGDDSKPPAEPAG